MKQFSTLCTCLCLMLLSCALWAAPVTYPGPSILDDTGVKVTPTSLTVASVTDLDGNAIAAPGAVAHFAGSNSSVVYDASSKGEAWITLTPVLAGHTFTNNAPIIFCSSDSQTLSGVKAKTDLIATNSADSPNQITGQSALTRFLAMTNSSNQFLAVAYGLMPPVTLPTTVPAGYGFTGLSGSDVTAIVTGILGATIDGGLTFKQISALSEAFMNGRFSISDATSAPYVRTVTYYRVDGTTPLAIQPTTYTDSTFSKVAPAGRAKPTFSNLP